jgi:hypothetical protein
MKLGRKPNVAVAAGAVVAVVVMAVVAAAMAADTVVAAAVVAVEVAAGIAETAATAGNHYLSSQQAASSSLGTSLLTLLNNLPGEPCARAFLFDRNVSLASPSIKAGAEWRFQSSRPLDTFSSAFASWACQLSLARNVRFLLAKVCHSV